MNRISTCSIFLIFFFFSSFGIWSQDDPWDLDLDSIIQEDNNEKNEDNQMQKNTTIFNWNLSILNEYEYFSSSDTPLNPDKIFPLDLFISRSSVNFSSKLNYSKVLQINSDLSGDFYYGMNSEKDWNDQLDLKWTIHELYFAYYPSDCNWLVIELGRKKIPLGNSYAYDIYNSFMYEKDNLKNRESSTIGSNIAGIQVLSKAFDLGLYYVPGGETENTSDFLRLNDSSSLFLTGNYYLKKIKINTFIYGNTEFDWNAGAGFSMEAGVRSVLYSDFSLGPASSRYIKQESEMFPGYYAYDANIDDKISYRANILGINLSLDNLPDIITELYYNSSGYSKKEWNDYYKNMDLISSTDYLNSPVGEYYVGFLGNEISQYDPFQIAQWMLYFRVYDVMGESGNIEWALNSFLSLQDFSVLASPEYIWNINSKWSWSLKGNLYLGEEDSLFGILPYWSNFQTFLKYSIKN